MAIALPEAERSGSVWSRSLLLLDQATSITAAQDGDMGHAAGLATEAITLSANSPILAVRQRAREFVIEAVGRWGRSPHLKSVHDLVVEGAR